MVINENDTWPIQQLINELDGQSTETIVLATGAAATTNAIRALEE